jgi:clan AA aspartic protease
MGMTVIRVRVANVRDPERAADVEMVVDSGAIYSVVPAPILRRVGVRPGRMETFGLADGRSVRRQVGQARFEIQGREGISNVIFGRVGDASLLGMVTLEELGLSLDPLKRRLRSLRLMIA